MVQVSAARYHAVAVSRDGRVYTWGSGLYGQLGHGDRYTRFEPTMVSALARVNVTGAAAGTRHTVAVCDLGEVYAWGSNEFGELGVDPRPVKPSEGSANPKLTLRGWLFGNAPSPSYSAPSSSGSGESVKKRRRSTLGMDTEEDPAGAFDMIFERLRDDSDESGRSGMTHATFGALVAGVQPAIPPPWERDSFNGSADELFDQRFGTMLGQSRDSAGRVEYLTLPRLVRGLAQVTRASLIIVASSVAFCGSDSRQCLDAAGALSAALVVAGSVYYGNSRSFEEELDDAIDPDIAHEMDSVIGEAEEILEELMDLFVEEHGAEPTEDEFLAWTESLKAQGAVAEKKAGKKSTPKKATTPAKKPAKKSTPAKPKAAKETKTSTRRRPPTRSTPGKK